MSKVKKITINPDIVLNPERIVGMPKDLQMHLKVAITNAAEVYECDWEDISWKVSFDKKSKQPYIRTIKK